MYLRLRSDIDSLSRLVKNKHRRFQRQPSAQRHFLLIATRKSRHRREKRWRLYSHSCDIVRGNRALASKVERPPASKRRSLALKVRLITVFRTGVGAIALSKATPGT